jgi:hypothetical protein
MWDFNLKTYLSTDNPVMSDRKAMQLLYIFRFQMDMCVWTLHFVAEQRIIVGGGDMRFEVCMASKIILQPSGFLPTFRRNLLCPSSRHSEARGSRLLGDVDVCYKPEVLNVKCNTVFELLLSSEFCTKNNINTWSFHFWYVIQQRFIVRILYHCVFCWLFQLL